MQEIDKLLELTEDSRVELASEFKQLMHTHLILGQSRWVCRYGTLSDGHEKLTDAQRYYQAIKELWYLSQNIRAQKALALFAQADLIDAEDELKVASRPSEKLRAEAKILQAKDKITSALVTVEDQMRMVDEYNKIRLELQPIVEAKYPGGIEQAEPDNWKAVFEYRMTKNPNDRTNNIPLPPSDKMRLGIMYKNMEAIAPAMIAHKDKFEQIPNEDPKKLNKFLKLIEEDKQEKQLETSN